MNLTRLFIYIVCHIMLTFIIIIWLFVWISAISSLRARKIRKLKYEGTWVVKKTKVSTVRERYVSWGEDSSWYYLYMLETEDETGNIYRSPQFRGVEHGWRTVEEMKVKYDWVDYNLSDKDNALRQLNDNKYRLEMELQNNPWFFKKRGLKKDIKAMEKYIEIANEWPITPYLVLNGHKISVWDTIDVYVNPEKPNQYYFDLDFTIENNA